MVTAILEAERSGSDATVYERVFDLSPAEVRALVREMVEQDLEGSELSCASFWLAVDDDGSPVAGTAAWIEADDAPGSAMLRASALGHLLGRDRWQAATPRLRALGAVDIPRQPGTLQIESAYALPGLRGRGVMTDVFERAIAHCRETRADVTRCQILSVVENDASARLFLRTGFHEVRRATTEAPEVRALFPGSGRILWERAW